MTATSITRQIVGLLAGFALLGSGTPLVVGDDWAYWRGADQTGISRETNLIETWDLKSKRNVLWTSDIGGRATPVILNGRVFLNCRTDHNINIPSEKIHSGEQVVCWDLESGEILWRDKFNVFQTDVPAPRVGWSSMTGDTETGYVYMHSVSGLFRCYDADGKVIWERSLFEEYGKISGYGGRNQTPIVDENRVIVNFVTSNWGETKGPVPANTFYAFDKRTGELLWVASTPGRPIDSNCSMPVVRVINGQRLLIFGDSDGSVSAMNARTGKMVWNFRMSRRGLNATIVVDGNYVYASHGEDNIDNQEFGRVQCINAIGEGDITETNSVWRVDGIKAGFCGLLVQDGILYVLSDTGDLHAMDSKTGTEFWKHKLGTVGKSGPVWADGKLYATEVNGNVHILKPSREGCEVLSHEELLGVSAPGFDEIYASPAISRGRVVIVSRDRTICLGEKEWNGKSSPVPPLAEEGAIGELAHIQVVPYEVTLSPGQSQSFKAFGYDSQGRLIGELSDVALTAEDLGDGKVDGMTFTAGSGEKDFGGRVVVAKGELKAIARIRTFPAADKWSWDFEGFTETRVPPTWLRAFSRLRPAEVDGSTAMRSAPAPDRPSLWVHIGPHDMSGYTIQADAKLLEVKRRLSRVGITCQRYNLILDGNANELTIDTWVAHLRLSTKMKFNVKPDAWYRMKLKVDIEDGVANVKGKVWERDKEEPSDWTLVAKDPNPNLIGSPGLYLYSTSESYFDNVQVTPK
ncbi:MAG: PQQ-binding-like beta-propeller repeat protein [Planctomycetaceae bacterium]|nr:PQQ-binding-like beta-propeller repeat protein [Planctomycetaceae bacterium]